MEIDTRGDQVKRLGEHAGVVVGIGADGQARALRPSLPTRAEFGTTVTANPGTAYTELSEDEAADQVVVSNTTGTTLEFWRNGKAFLLPSGVVQAFRGLANANEIQVRRADTSNTQVTLTWVAELF